MNTSQNGINLIKQSEGCKLTAYQDSVGVWTIGYGDTGIGVVKGLVINQADAEQRLRNRLAKEFEPAINSNVKVKITANQFDALVCLAYNIGVSAFKSSTLLRKLNAGDYQGAADQFKVWNRAGGEVLKGLITRRANERALFLQP